MYIAYQPCGGVCTSTQNVVTDVALRGEGSPYFGGYRSANRARELSNRSASLLGAPPLNSRFRTGLDAFEPSLWQQIRDIENPGSETEGRNWPDITQTQENDLSETCRPPANSAKCHGYF